MSTHDLYVAAAYGVTAVVLAGLILVLLRDKHLRKCELAELDRQGLRRRSGRGAAA